MSILEAYKSLDFTFPKSNNINNDIEKGGDDPEKIYPLLRRILLESPG
jgi:hypothetical protein